MLSQSAGVLLERLVVQRRQGAEGDTPADLDINIWSPQFTKPLGLLIQDANQALAKVGLASLALSAEGQNRGGRCPERRHRSLLPVRGPTDTP
jgi:hypothetical protein